ncbi:PAAR domain-containing protein [Pantoea sp. MBD-2R]|uniref:PAAR domain-containing protein n=1 Tax=Pantoea sp. MBD-2R TaxID=3141540 RepID=UPI0031834876
MSEFNAARELDDIAHTASKTWMIAGLIGGAILGAAAVVVTGGAALVAVTAAAAAGATAAGGVGEVLGSMSWAPRHVTGKLADGSPDVIINDRAAIRAHLSTGECDEHSGSKQLVAEGSIKVYINNFPAARIGDRLTCSAEIFSGSSNVFIGGSKRQTDDISAEIPGWVNWVMLGVGAAAIGVLASPAIALLSTLGALGGGYAGNYIGGRFFGEGSDGQKWSMLAGGLVGGAAGGKGGAKFDGWRRGTSEKPFLSVEPESPSMSLADAVGQSMAKRWIAKGRELADAKAPELSALLSDDQIGALYGYTTDPGYEMINPALRGSTELTPEIEAFSQHASAGLDNLPTFDGITLRGIKSLPSEVLNQYQVGSTVSDKTFMSTDSLNAFKGAIQMKIDGYSGRDIDFLSSHSATETEVLFKPDTKFVVTERSEQNGVTRISLKEL